MEDAIVIEVMAGRVMKSKHLNIWLAAGLFVAMGGIVTSGAIGCGGGTVTVTVTQSTQTTATTEELALGKNLTLETDPKQESNQSPRYDISIKTPVLRGSDDRRVKNFNQSVSNMISDQVNEFKQQAAQNAALPGPENFKSTLSTDYTLKSPPGQNVSVMITSDIYYAGGAHPGRAFQTINYGLSDGRTLRLSDLFSPGSDYLNALATYCSQELKQRNVLLFPEGTAPTEDNYKIWALTSGGLEITFGEYQVAPYAAGPQTVVIPYNNLRGSLDPKGPVSEITG